MKLAFVMALVLGGLLAGPRLPAQTQGSGGASGGAQNKPAGKSQNPPAGQQPAQPQPQPNSNPFPEDTDSVPVIPASPSAVPPSVGDNATRMPMPPDDLDPVRSPEDAGPAAGEQQSSSSSLSGMGALPPDADAGDDTTPGRRGRKGEQVVPEHHETAAEDENVGGYYLDRKDWKAALSRFQSALVLDPDNPDVYWGLAESERHLGDFADARENYLKVMEYDPDSHHAKEAKKALQDPELANAKASAPAKPSPLPQ